MTTNENRTIGELLKESTFQGMTDGEILTIINYTAHIAVQDALSDFNVQQTAIKTQAIADMYKSQAEYANKKLADLISQPLKLAEVVDNDA